MQHQQVPQDITAHLDKDLVSDQYHPGKRVLRRVPVGESLNSWRTSRNKSLAVMAS
jgi:hypothetical protein